MDRQSKSGLPAKYSEEDCYLTFLWPHSNNSSEPIDSLTGSLTVSINSRADDGDTALHLAALHGHAQCVEVCGFPF